MTTNRATTGIGLVLSEPTLGVSTENHLPHPSHCFARFQGFAPLNRWTDGQSTPVFLIPHLGDVLFSQDGDGDSSCNHAMARCAPGHFSFHPDDLDGREMVTTVRTATDGELNVEFKATIHMEMSAFQQLAEKKFKGVYWLTDDPHIEREQERQAKYLKDKEESLERITRLEERIKDGKARRLYDVVVLKVDHLNCEQMAKKLVMAMPWMNQKEASELAWRIHENGEATVFTTTDEKMKGIVGGLLLSSIKRLKSTNSRIEAVEEN